MMRLWLLKWLMLVLWQCRDLLAAWHGSAVRGYWIMELYSICVTLCEHDVNWKMLCWVVVRCGENVTGTDGALI